MLNQKTQAGWIDTKTRPRRVVPRWQRYRMGRPLSPPQIHQKIMWMLSNFHKTISEYWQRTQGTQKGSSFSWKGEQRIEWIPKETSKAVYRPLPTPPQGREASVRQLEMEGKGQRLPQRPASSTKLCAGSQLLTMSSQDPGLLTSARRVAAWDHLPRGDTQYTWDGSLMAHPGNWAAWTGEVIKVHRPPGTVCSPSTCSPELLRPGKGTKRMPNWVCAFAEYLGTWTWVA